MAGPGPAGKQETPKPCPRLSSLMAPTCSSLVLLNGGYGEREEVRSQAVWGSVGPTLGAEPPECRLQAGARPGVCLPRASVAETAPAAPCFPGDAAGMGRTAKSGAVCEHRACLLLLPSHPPRTEGRAPQRGQVERAAQSQSAPCGLSVSPRPLLPQLRPSSPSQGQKLVEGAGLHEHQGLRWELQVEKLE